MKIIIPPPSPPSAGDSPGGRLVSIISRTVPRAEL